MCGEGKYQVARQSHDARRSITSLERTRSPSDPGVWIGHRTHSMLRAAPPKHRRPFKVLSLIINETACQGDVVGTRIFRKRASVLSLGTIRSVPKSCVNSVLWHHQASRALKMEGIIRPSHHSISSYP